MSKSRFFRFPRKHGYSRIEKRTSINLPSELNVWWCLQRCKKTFWCMIRAGPFATCSFHNCLSTGALPESFGCHNTGRLSVRLWSKCRSAWTRRTHQTHVWFELLQHLICKVQINLHEVETLQTLGKLLMSSIKLGQVLLSLSQCFLLPQWVLSHLVSGRPLVQSVVLSFLIKPVLLLLDFHRCWI